MNAANAPATRQPRPAFVSPHPRRIETMSSFPPPDAFMSEPRPTSRRAWLATSAGLCGLSFPEFLTLRSSAAANSASGGRAKSCIIIYCWGGISHLESFDLKPEAPSEIRGTFDPISTVVPGIQISEHLPLLARQTDKLAIIRSIHHDDSAHGRGMYWNLTGHRPPRAGNIPPAPDDWPYRRWPP